jgi:Domain of unknown function (DUF4232)
MARCTAAYLRGAVVLEDEGAGQRYGRLVVINEGEECTLYGFSGLQLVDGDGIALPTNAQWDLDPGPSLVTLPNRGIAVANLHWTVVPGSGDAQGGDCQPTPAGLELIPPDETEQFEVPWTYGPVCGQGTIHISAYYSP